MCASGAAPLLHCCPALISSDASSSIEQRALVLTVCLQPRVPISFLFHVILLIVQVPYHWSFKGSSGDDCGSLECQTKSSTSPGVRATILCQQWPTFIIDTSLQLKSAVHAKPNPKIPYTLYGHARSWTRFGVHYPGSFTLPMPICQISKISLTDSCNLGMTIGSRSSSSLAGCYGTVAMHCNSTYQSSPSIESALWLEVICRSSLIP